MTNTVSMKSEVPALNKAGRKRIVQVLVTMAVTWLILFVCAGRLNWWAAWVLVFVQSLVFATMGVWVIRRSPEVINERGKRPDEMQPWDRVFGFVYVPQLFLVPILAGLDSRFVWSVVPLWLSVVCFVALVPAMLLPYWTMAVNKFLTTTVRMQRERGHYVVTTGPYRYVRHPMYVGAILTWLFTPLALGSWWALVPGVVAGVAMMVRTGLEDEMLQRELPGYKVYAEETRYRLWPGLW